MSAASSPKLINDSAVTSIDRERHPLWRIRDGFRLQPIEELQCTLRSVLVICVSRRQSTASKERKCYDTVSSQKLTIWLLGTGACILYGISRVVIGENETFLGGEAYLKQRGIEVVNMQSKECKDLMDKFILEKPEIWYVKSSKSLEATGAELNLSITGTRILGKKREFTQRSQSDRTLHLVSHTDSLWELGFSLIVLFQLN